MNSLLHPTITAALNATSAILLVIAYRAIRRLDVARHRRWMLAAAPTSAVFLASYLAYHARVGSVRVLGTGSGSCEIRQATSSRSSVAHLTPFANSFTMLDFSPDPRPVE